MNEQTLEILEKNIEQGRKAKAAYDMYIREFIEDSYQSIHETFDSLSIADTEGLKTLKLMQSAVRALDERIRNDIESSNLANAQLTAEADAGQKH